MALCFSCPFSTSPLFLLITEMEKPSSSRVLASTKMQETHSSFSPLQFTAAAAMNTINGGGVEEEEEEEEDHFDRLPDAMIIEIFGKVLHAKYLIRCFSVCKRFASLLPETHTVFISIRFRKNHNPISAIFKNIVNIPLRIFHRIRMVPALSSSSSSSSTDYHAPLCSVSCMVKFSGLRSLRIEFGDPSRSASSNCCIHNSWMKYKAVIGARFKAAVFFSTFGDYPKEQEQDFNGLIPDDVLEVVEGSFLKLIKGGLEHALGNHNLAQSLIKNLPWLSELEITNKRIGKLCMGKEQIVELRRRRRTNLGTISGSGVKSELLSFSDVIGCNGGVGVQLCHTAIVLELPSSASVMKWAIVAVVSPEDEEIVMGRDIGLILGAFEGGGEDDDDDDEYGKVIDEVVNTVREAIIADQDEPSFMTHRLQLIED